VVCLTRACLSAWNRHRFAARMPRFSRRFTRAPLVLPGLSRSGPRAVLPSSSHPPYPLRAGPGQGDRAGPGQGDRAGPGQGDDGFFGAMAPTRGSWTPGFGMLLEDLRPPTRETGDLAWAALARALHRCAGRAGCVGE
jgi:hypothetical protein